jgi:hypothetical protein
LLIAVLSGCGSDSSDGKTVAVNLSLVVNGRQAHHPPAVSRLFAWIERWIPGATPAWAQAVTDIASIQVQVTGPGISTPASTTVPVSNPTSGQEIPVTIQAPVGPNRTITVSAFNAANAKIFGGTVANVNLTAGAPIDLEVTLVRLFTVTVRKQGTGSGTITSSPAGIDCGVNCANQSTEFPEGTRVSLNAAAASGSVFGGWSGDCSGTNVCTVEAAANVTALFTAAAATNRLTVNVGGPGTGTVTSNPSGIFCPPSCTADFATGSTVALDASATNGSAFGGWSGGGCSGTGPCIVAIVGNPTVSATFTAAPTLQTLTVTTLGMGTGTVSSDPPGITGCDATCTAGFVRGTAVTLTATPTGGSTFIGWGGACSGTGLCFVDMSVDRSVTASFDPPVNRSLVTIQKTGTGTGRVTSSPRGIDCGSTCTAAFGTGSFLTLIPTPDPGSTFTGWSGNGCFGPGNCTSVINGDQVFLAQFDLAPDLVALSVDRSGGGSGTVTSDPAGISCGLACRADYLRGTTVTLTATPTPGSFFEEWRGGPCDRNTGPCVLLLDRDSTANARFGTGGG